MERDGAMSGSEMFEQSTVGAPRADLAGSKAIPFGSAIRMRCPHCDAMTKARSSRQETRTYKEFVFQCHNVDADPPCGHVFVAAMEVVRTLVPSSNPNPKVNLPVVPARAPRARPEHANDDVGDPGGATPSGRHWLRRRPR